MAGPRKRARFDVSSVIFSQLFDGDSDSEDDDMDLTDSLDVLDQHGDSSGDEYDSDETHIEDKTNFIEIGQ
jgi:hypothetical protein